MHLERAKTKKLLQTLSDKILEVDETSLKSKGVKKVEYQIRPMPPKQLFHHTMSTLADQMKREQLAYPVKAMHDFIETKAGNEEHLKVIQRNTQKLLDFRKHQELQAKIKARQAQLGLNYDSVNLDPCHCDHKESPVHLKKHHAFKYDPNDFDVEIRLMKTYKKKCARGEKGHREQTAYILDNDDYFSDKDPSSPGGKRKRMRSLKTVKSPSIRIPEASEV